MKTLLLWLIVLLAFPLAGQQQGVPSSISEKSFNPSTLLWYDAPAAKWQDALPVGNGRLGAMVFGRYGEERIQLNEETYWSGGPYSTVVKGGKEVLPEIQKLVFDGKYLEAHKLFGRNLMGYPVEQMKYQSLANLHLFFEGQKEVTGYKRWLDLSSAVTGVTYTVGDVQYTREVFASAPDQAIIVRITANKPESISFRANLRGVRNQTHSNYATDYFRMDSFENDGLVLTGKSADYLAVEGKLRYEARVKAVNEGGSIRTSGEDLIVEKANAVTLYFIAATNFVNYHDVSGDQHARVENYLQGISRKSFDQIREASVSDYQLLFNRATLKLPVVDNSYLPTTERKTKIQDSDDPSLAALSYHFGRFLLISSSRAGTEPANLQGIWNDDMNPAWDSKYTTNINTEMNYWPAESSNLSECAEPLFRMIRELTDQGTTVAKEHYGAGGWVFHQNTDIWRVAAPMDGPSWGTFTVGGAWLCTHLWEHYQYSRDIRFLQEFYPVIEGSVQFFVDFLILHPNGKWLVTNPSTSPENFPDGGGNKPFFDETTGSVLDGTTICAGSSIDMQILYDLFGYYLEASTQLQKTSSLINKVKEVREKLVPPQIGSSGALQEWTDDWKSLEKNHRHFSHLYGLYPGKALIDRKTPALVESYKKVLEERGDGAAGWSRAWKMALWARLNDGDRSNKIFKGYLKEQSCAQLFAMCGKPMQVDGSFGVTAAITEMLVQSHEGFINPLPALPGSWNDGAYKGVCVRGGFELDMEWKNSKLVRMEVLSKGGEVCRIKGASSVKFNGRNVTVKKLNDDTIEFSTSKGSHYQVSFTAEAQRRKGNAKGSL